MTPGQKIADDAFDAYGLWLERYAQDLENVEIMDRPAIYSYWAEGVGIDLAIAAQALSDHDSTE